MELELQDCGHFVKAEIPFDLDLLDCHAFNPQRYPFLLESNCLTDSSSGVDMLFAFPGECIEALTVGDTRFFRELDQAVSQPKSANNQVNTNGLPFTGGWFVFLSYELIGSIEAKLSSLIPDARLPITSAVRIPVAVIKNHKDKTSWIVAEPDQIDRISDVWHDLQSMTNTAISKPRVSIEEAPSHDFLQGVQQIKSYLIEGDTLQVNLSRQWTGRIQDDSSYLDIYRSLRASNPSPFAGLACYGDSVICSSSPERLVSCSGNTVEMRPVAGTRPRSTNDELDAKWAKDLLANAKENAEHIMLIDLIRNDLGRICQAGTIHVDESMTLESYAAVHHIVSNVSGKLSPDTTPSEIIKAVFPGGTITGCPKVRCMEIIQELEKVPRGAYTGSMGYINLNGDLDLNILIRSFTVSGKAFSLRTGAGIVADSIADNELVETRHKAKALLNALSIDED